MSRVRVVILAGGESRRMGASKPSVLFGSETLLERACRIAREATGRAPLVSLAAAQAHATSHATRVHARAPQTARVLVCSSRRACASPRSANLRAPHVTLGGDLPLSVRTHVVRDTVRGRGPVAGLLAALDAPIAAKDDAFLVMAVDMPYLDAAVLRRLLAGAAGASAAAPVYRGRMQPACAVFSRALRPLVAQAVAEGRGLRWILETARAVSVPIPRRPGPSPFLSIDTPAILRTHIKRLSIPAGESRRTE
jgi:molybdopterin-guanine dinucleotide biosynthesis protein A